MPKHRHHRAGSQEGIAPLESVLCTEELHRRPSRPPDYEAENRALVALAQALADSPHTILQTLADTVLEVVHAGSAGVSLLTTQDGGKRFHWPAIAGVWQPHIGGGTPREFGPCGDVLDRNAPLLFRHLERRYTYFLPVTPPVEEALLVPFYVEGNAVGTVWAIAHDDRRQFDAEDLRQLESLGRFASAAYQAVASLDALKQGGDALRHSQLELAQHVAEVQQTKVEAQGARRAALNLMEDAVQSRQAMESLNVKLRESEERYRTLFEAAPMALFVCDPHAVIQQYNRRAVELWGREPECGVEQHCGSVKLWLPNGTLLPHAQSPMVDVLRTGIPALNVEVCIERPDGSRLPVLVNFAALKNAAGDMTGAITSFIDITERKHAEEEISRLLAVARQRERELREKQEQLVQAGKLAMIGELATGVAHELNNPLNNIGLFVGNLIDHLAAHEIDASRVSHDLHLILTQVSRAALIITQVRTFGRAAGEDRQRLAIHEAIRSAVALVREQLRLQNIEVTLHLDPSNPMVLGNRLQLEQVFLNLLTNAHDAMKDTMEKTLSLSTVVRAKNVHVLFTDTGSGIPADVLPRIFDPFFTTKEVGQGTGLGLSISYSIIKEHDGTITADSRPGEGTTIVIDLPLARSGDEPHERRDR